MNDTDAINNLYPGGAQPLSDERMKLAILQQARTGSRDQWLSDIQWAAP